MARDGNVEGPTRSRTMSCQNAGEAIERVFTEFSRAMNGGALSEAYLRSVGRATKDEHGTAP